MYDQQDVLQQLRELGERMEDLRSLAPVTPERLGADRVFAAAVERNVQIALQAAIDIGAWVIADQGWRDPNSYADTFYVLAEEGYLDRSVAFRLADFAGYRNILVHGYLRVSHEVTARLATEGLTDLTALVERFAGG